MLQSTLFGRFGVEGAEGVGMVRRSPRRASVIRSEGCRCSSRHRTSLRWVVGVIGCGPLDWGKPLAHSGIYEVDDIVLLLEGDIQPVSPPPCRTYLM
jgi:hypothetical protein